MTIENIFNQLSQHMLEGLSYHNEFAQAYDFLGLYGYSIYQKYHRIEEEQNYQTLSHYYITHYFKLLQYENITIPEIIPQSWFNYTTQDVDQGTLKKAIKDLMTKWIEWEKSTKELYQALRQELISLNEIAAALYIDQYICDVDKELSHAQKQLIRLESINYDLTIIMPEQEELYKKYKKKLGW